MSLIAIKTIVDAEADAEKRRLEALVEAKRIVAAAEITGKEEVQKAVTQAEAKVKLICGEAEEQEKKVAAKSLEVARKTCQALENEAEAKMDRAVAVIMERVVSRR